MLAGISRNSDAPGLNSVGRTFERDGISNCGAPPAFEVASVSGLTISFMSICA